MNYSFSFGLTGNSRRLKQNFKFSFLNLMFCTMKVETALQLLWGFLCDQCRSVTFFDADGSNMNLLLYFFPFIILKNAVP